MAEIDKRGLPDIQKIRQLQDDFLANLEQEAPQTTPELLAQSNRLGITYVGLGEYEKARALNPNDPGIYLNLGMGYLIADSQTESQEILEQAFQQLGDYRSACNLVGIPASEVVTKGAEKPLLVDEIRSLFMSVAEKK